MISDDFVVVAFDTYGDSRNNYLLLANAFGSQLDARAINAITDEDRYDINFNVDLKQKGILSQMVLKLSLKYLLHHFRFQMEIIKNGILILEGTLLEMVFQLS